MHESSVKIEVYSKDVMIYYGALSPEEGILPGGRSCASVSVNGDKLIIELRASDITALRAAVNSFIRWYVAIMRCIREVVGDGH
ncbi:MAG: KEOPS complex subunit Pcc1 [Thermoproteota archaeon]